MLTIIKILWVTYSTVTWKLYLLKRRVQSWFLPKRYRFIRKYLNDTVLPIEDLIGELKVIDTIPDFSVVNLFFIGCGRGGEIGICHEYTKIKHDAAIMHYSFIAHDTWDGYRKKDVSLNDNKALILNTLFCPTHKYTFNKERYPFAQTEINPPKLASANIFVYFIDVDIIHAYVEWLSYLSTIMKKLKVKVIIVCADYYLFPETRVYIDSFKLNFKPLGKYSAYATINH